MNILFGQNLKGFADLLRGKVNDPIVLAYNVVGIPLAAFGLLNSTPHSLRPAASEESRTVLRGMTLAALSVTTGSIDTGAG